MSEQQTPEQPDLQPLFAIEKIYLKDLSLELPNAPQVFFEREAPGIEVSMHNQATGLEQEGMFEVVLTVTVTAKIQDKTVFLVEAAQAGLFQIRNVARPELEAVLGTLCPAAAVCAGSGGKRVQRAGFPPVTLQHMNFDLIYQQRMREMQAQQATAGASPAAPAH